MRKRQQARNPRGRLLCACVALALLGGSMVSAQPDKSDSNPLRQGGAAGDPLTAKQSRLADRYDQLELLAGRLAELSRASQPRRAHLLRELVAKSRERDIAGRFEEIIHAIGNDSLGKATSAQVELQVDLQKMLDLLLQEDRDKQIESERKRIRKYLAEVKRLIQLQRGIKARTDGGDEADQLTKDQQHLAETTEKLEQLIQATEGSESSKRDSSKNSKQAEQQGKAGEDKPQDGKSADTPPAKQQEGGKKPDGKKPDDKKSAGKKASGQPQEGQPSPSGKPNKSPPSPEQRPSQPSQSGGEPSGQSPESPQGPAERAQQRLKQAQQRMQQALERLEAARLDKAVDRQEQALRELEQAKAELERILRQLREEELERMLVLLEARFRKMLDAQVEVYEQTKKLEASQASVSASVPEHEIEIASGRLDRQERQIVREAERALVLLREDGTTVAFPEAIEQARDDMQTVARRLGEVKIALITQGLEEDIIIALEETLAALQQAIKKARAQKSQPQQSKRSSGEKPLVDQLAELRMIRALQNRINRRTERYGKILGDQPAIEAELVEELEALARRQERIFEATRDLDSGRNR